MKRPHKQTKMRDNNNNYHHHNLKCTKIFYFHRTNHRLFNIHNHIFMRMERMKERRRWKDECPPRSRSIDRANAFAYAFVLVCECSMTTLIPLLVYLAKSSENNIIICHLFSLLPLWHSHTFERYLFVK